MTTTTITTTSTIAASQATHGNVPKGYSPSTRVEPIPRPDFPHHQYPRWIGHKFTPTGQVLPFPGNTVLCHLSQSSALHASLTGLHTLLSQHGLSHCFALLPPSSYHMTFYEGITYRIPTSTNWPAPEILPYDCSLGQCHAHVISRLSTLRLGSTGGGPPYKLRIAGFEPLTDGIAFKLVPENATEEKRMRNLREQMADSVGVRQPGFGVYGFHMSLGYCLKWLSEEETKEVSDVLDEWLQENRTVSDEGVEFGAPEVCVYDDMTGFRRVFYLE
ncbi:uncharacterized protein AB675_3841 [Cyphellophora attinorum]|uniref:DUF1868 domain-containing protein n=1 Tax=Cyphellophora attinorum TaxID=1664694 RepID=A0A0N1HH30_9EURO|nr:uncharacterized protein AB675_3841 [Phialophora attinorum]KPI34943.1 hypothetical protein AB675_3841 [Phialophora attinorum]